MRFSRKPAREKASTPEMPAAAAGVGAAGALPRAMMRIVREACLILVVAAVGGGLVHQMRDPVTDDPAAPVAVSETEMLTGPKMVDLDTAVQWFDGGTVLFIDARDKYAYAEGHVPGALHLDPAETDTWMIDIYQRLPPDAWVVTYADADGDVHARLLAERLHEIGFANVYYLARGWPAWIDRGLPVSDTIEGFQPAF